MCRRSDWQFYPPRFFELQEKAELAFKVCPPVDLACDRLSSPLLPQRKNGIKAETPERDDGEKVDAEEVERERQELQAEIDNAEDLTEAEESEKADLQGLGYENWSRRDFLAFVKGCEAYGRCAFPNVFLFFLAETCDPQRQLPSHR